MKRRYIQPSIKAIEVKARTMLASSWDKDALSGINRTPGSQESFGVKEFDDEFDW